MDLLGVWKHKFVVITVNSIWLGVVTFIKGYLNRSIDLYGIMFKIILNYI